MILKLFYILLTHFIICNADPMTPVPYTLKPPATRSGLAYGNLNNGLQDCRPVSPEPRSDLNQVAPMNGLVSQSVQDPYLSNNQNQYAYVPKNADADTRLNRMNNENEDTDTRLNRNQSPNYEPESPQGQRQLQTEPNPTELSKLVEKCVTNKLARRNGPPRQYDQLDSGDLLNTRRSNPTDSLEEDSLEVQSRNGNLNDLDESLGDPAQAVGLRRLNNPNSNVLLINNRKVCYACTSANNPNCWMPNSMTTVKYCNRANDACITKTYTAGNNKVVIRDCGNSCVEKDVGVHPEYKSCSICHSNLCNDSSGAFNLHINLHSLILGLILIALVKRAV